MTDSIETSVKTFFKTFAGSTSSNEDSKEFIGRIRTYIEGQKWVRRPLILSPSVCARYGWKCLNYNLLECVTCGAKICSPEPNINMPDVYKACIEKNLNELKSSHKTHCPWPLTPSPESLVKMLPMPKEEAFKHYLQRIRQCQLYSSFLPQVQESSITTLGLNEALISSLCKLCDISEEDIQEFGSSAVSLAVTGWTLVSNSDNQKKYIECENCQRSVWTGSYNQLTTTKIDNIAGTSQNGSTISIKLEESPPFKRFKKDNFDPLEEHRPWCLWIVSERKCSFANGKSPNYEDDNPGFRIFIKSLLKNVHNQETEDSEVNPTREHIRNVRDLLDTWTESVE